MNFFGSGTKLRRKTRSQYVNTNCDQERDKKKDCADSLVPFHRITWYIFTPVRAYK